MNVRAFEIVRDHRFPFDGRAQKLAQLVCAVSLSLHILRFRRPLGPQADHKLAAIDLVAQFALPLIVVELGVPENIVPCGLQLLDDNGARGVIFALVADENVVGFGSDNIGNIGHREAGPRSRNMQTMQIYWRGELMTEDFSLTISREKEARPVYDGGLRFVIPAKRSASRDRKKYGFQCATIPDRACALPG
jgi:hypothetical protein